MAGYPCKEPLSGAVSSCLRSELCRNPDILAVASPGSRHDLKWLRCHSVPFHRPGCRLQYTGLLPGSLGHGVDVSGISPMMRIGQKVDNTNGICHY